MVFGDTDWLLDIWTENSEIWSPGAGCIKVGRTPSFYVGRWVDSRRTRAQRWNGLYQEIITRHKYHWFLRTFYATTSSSDVNYRPKLRRTPVTPRLVRLASEWTPDLTSDVSVSLGRTAFMQPAPDIDERDLGIIREEHDLLLILIFLRKIYCQGTAVGTVPPSMLKLFYFS